MSNFVLCNKLKKDLPKIVIPPFPGKMGTLIQDHISQEAWHMWLIEQTKIINEYRLDPLDIKAQQLLEEEMLAFLSITSIITG